MSERYTILLATKTPLYAPIYLAKQARLDTIFDKITFHIKPLRWSIRTGPGANIDPLIRDVLLGRNVAGGRVIAAVGDPFRSTIKEQGVLDRPLVILGLVQQMFFWLINGERALYKVDHPKLHEKFERIIVHPRHMTGYAVACYDLMTTCGIKSAHEADSFLFSNIAPGFEETYYKTFQWWKGPGALDFSYLTTDVSDYLSVCPKSC